MTAEVRAWARERIARAIAALYVSDVDEDWPDHRIDADAVLAVLPELLTDERVVEAVGDTLALHQGVTPGRLARLAQATVADVLAGEQP